MTGTLSAAERSYPTSEVRGSSQECQAAMAQEWQRRATQVRAPGVGDGQGGLACCNSWGRTHLALMGEPRGFSRVAAGFSSYDGDLSLPLGLALGQPSPWVGPGKPNLPLGLRGKAGGGHSCTLAAWHSWLLPLTSDVEIGRASCRERV